MTGQVIRPKFLLDENIIVAADQLKDPKGNDDLSSHRLLVNIVCNCYSIVIDGSLEKKYYKKFAELQNDNQGWRSPVVVRLVASLLNNTTKLIRNEYLPKNNGFAEIPEDDRDIVRLAAFTEAILVSFDDRLIKKFNISGIDRDYNCKIVLPIEALKLIE